MTAEAPPSESDENEIPPLAISPDGRIHIAGALAEKPTRSVQRLASAFEQGVGHGLLELGTTDLTARVPPEYQLLRAVARIYFTALCALPNLEDVRAALDLAPPREDLDALVAAAPPMLGAEYLTTEVLVRAWTDLQAAIRDALAAFKGTAPDWLRSCRYSRLCRRPPRRAHS